MDIQKLVQAEMSHMAYRLVLRWVCDSLWTLRHFDCVTWLFLVIRQTVLLKSSFLGQSECQIYCVSVKYMTDVSCVWAAAGSEVDSRGMWGGRDQQWSSRADNWEFLTMEESGQLLQQGQRGELILVPLQQAHLLPATHTHTHTQILESPHSYSHHTQSAHDCQLYRGH